MSPAKKFLTEATFFPGNGSADLYAKLFKQRPVAKNKIVWTGSRDHHGSIFPVEAGIFYGTSGEKITKTFDSRQFLQMKIHKAASNCVMDADGHILTNTVAKKLKNEAN